MKLLFDENLSPRLVGALADVYPGSVHVHESGLGSTDDGAIWKYAKDNGFAIVSKDSDFQERSVCLLRAAAPIVTRFIQEDEESWLRRDMQLRQSKSRGLAV